MDDEHRKNTNWKKADDKLSVREVREKLRGKIKKRDERKFVYEKQESTLRTVHMYEKRKAMWEDKETIIYKRRKLHRRIEARRNKKE